MGKNRGILYPKPPPLTPGEWWIPPPVTCFPPGWTPDWPWPDTCGPPPPWIIPDWWRPGLPWPDRCTCNALEAFIYLNWCPCWWLGIAEIFRPNFYFRLPPGKWVTYVHQFETEPPPETNLIYT